MCAEDPSALTVCTALRDRLRGQPGLNAAVGYVRGLALGSKRCSRKTPFVEIWHRFGFTVSTPLAKFWFANLLTETTFSVAHTDTEQLQFHLDFHRYHFISDT
jgi:hypothetical protein